MRVAMVSVHAQLWCGLSEPGSEAAITADVHAAHSAAALVRAGEDVTAYARRDASGEVAAGPLAEGVRVQPIAAGPARPLSDDEALAYVAEFGHALADEWSAKPPHVVHAHGWVAGLASQVAARRLGLPVIQSFHGLGSMRRRVLGGSTDGMRMRLERSLALSAARVIATSTEEVFELFRLGVPQRCSTVVPPGVDAERFARVGGHRESAPSAPFRVLLVSTLQQTVEAERLLAAAALLPDVHVVVAGGPDPARIGAHLGAQRVLACARKLGLADRVTLLGRVPYEEMPQLYRSVDALVSIPELPATPLSALEAMACGRAVVACASGGLVDIVIDGITGIHVPARDTLGLVDGLRRLRADPVLRDSMGLAGSDRARTRFPWSRIAAETMRVYRSVGRRTRVEVGAQ